MQLAKAAEFGRTYVPVMALSLLLVLLLTVRQARDISVPVEKLAALARGVAGQDFAGTTGLARSDELGELADSFDQMNSSVATRQEKLPVELRIWAFARKASLCLSAASPRARSMAMLELEVAAVAARAADGVRIRR